MAWGDTYRGDLRTHRHHIPPQLPETRGMWVRATIPQYFRNEIINAVTIKAPTLDYFKRYHSKNWHNKAVQWPKAFRVATDVGEGIYEIRSPWVNFTDLTNQKTGSERTIDYYDAYGNRVTEASLIPSTFDLEQARFRSVAWYPGAVAYRVQFPQFDEVLVGTQAWNEHVEKVIQMEIMQKSQAMNVRLWDSSYEAYVLDYDPDFTTQTSANPMSWGSIPYYVNSIAWYRTTVDGKIRLNPITPEWIASLSAKINLPPTQANWEAVRNDLRSVSFWYDSSSVVNQNGAELRQQTVGSVNRGVADLPDNMPSGYNVSNPALRLKFLRDTYIKNSWWMVPSEFTIFFQGSGRIEQPQIVYPVARDTGGNPLYPVYNLTDRTWAHPAGDFRFNPLDLERLYQAAFYNYDVTMPKLAVMHPDTRTYMNQLNMIRTSLQQTRRKFGPADMALDGEFRDLEIFVDMAAPKNIIYLLGVDSLHVAFSDYDGMLNPRELPTQTMVDTMVAWTAYKWMIDNMRVHGIYWGFTTRI